MKKLSVEQASALLKTLGVAAQVVANNEDADTDIDLDVFSEEAEQKIAASITPALRQTLTDEIGNAKVKQFGDMERKAAAKILGVLPSEIKGKSLDELFSMVQEKFSATDNTTDNEYIQRIQRMQEDFDAQISQKDLDIAAANRKYIERDINSGLAKHLEKIPRKGKLEVQAAALKAHILANIGELGYDETNNTLTLTKDGKLVLNDKNKPYDFDELAKQWAEDTGIVATSTAGDTPTDKIVYTPPNQRQSMDSIDMTKVAESWFDGK